MDMEELARVKLACWTNTGSQTESLEIIQTEDPASGQLAASVNVAGPPASPWHSWATVGRHSPSAES